MPLTSAYLVVLDAEERRELERRAREVTGPWRDVQRARMVLYAGTGFSTRGRASRAGTGFAMSRSRSVWTVTRRSSVVGDAASLRKAVSMAWQIVLARAARVVFPPEQVAEVVAVACELPKTHDKPLGRFSRSELHRLVIERGVTEASASTIWRWLHDAALKPWQQRSDVTLTTTSDYSIQSGARRRGVRRGVGSKPGRSATCSSGWGGGPRVR